MICSDGEEVPVTDDGKIVLNSLIVDICACLKERHRNFGVTYSLGDTGHAPRKALDGTPCLGRAGGEVEHR